MRFAWRLVFDLRSMLFDLIPPGEEIFGGVFEAVPEGFFEVAAEDFRNPFDSH